MADYYVWTVLSSQDENFQDELITGAIEERLKLPSVSSALLLAFGIGTIEALAMFFGSGLFLNMMGVSPVSSKNPSYFPSFICFGV